MPFIWTLPVKGEHKFKNSSQMRPAARTGGTGWARPDDKREFVIGPSREYIPAFFISAKRTDSNRQYNKKRIKRYV
jgi:hypothetical protein